MTRSSPQPTIALHFVGRAAAVREIYDRLVRVAESFGPIRQEPKKTSIHLTIGSAFAGIATRRDALILTIKSTAEIDSPRVVRRDAGLRESAGIWRSVSTDPSRWIAS